MTKDLLYKISILLCLMTTFTTSATVAQNLDSLEAKISSFDADTFGVNQINEIIRQNARKNSDFSIQYAEKNLKTAIDIDYPKGEADARWQLGVIYRIKGRYKQAIEQLNKSTALLSQIEDQKSQSTVLNELGLAYRGNLQIDESIYTHQQSIEIARAIGDTANVVRSMSNLGNVYEMNSQLEEARQQKLEGLKLAKAFKNTQMQGSLLINIGNYYLRLNEIDSAIAYYQDARVIQEQRGDLEELSRVLNNLGLTYSNMGQHAKALQFSLDGLKLREQIGDKNGIAYSCTIIGRIYSQLDEQTKALNQFKKAAEIYKELNSQFRYGITLTNMAKVYSQLDSLSRSLQLERQALKIIKRSGGCFDLDPILGMAEVFGKLNQHDSSKFYHEIAVARAVSCKRPEIESISLIALASYDQESGQMNSAIKKLQRARDLTFQTGRIEDRKEATGELYRIHQNQSNYEKAFFFMKEFHELSDSLFNQAKERELATTEARFVFDQEKQQLLFEQEKERLALENEKQWITNRFRIAIAGILVILIVAGFIISSYRSKAALNKKLAQSNQNLEAANEKLQQLDQFKTRLFANINHDFRTPLTLIQGYTKRIGDSRESYLSDSAQQDLQNLQLNAESLTEMTNEIQDLLLLEESKLKLNFNQVNLVEYLDRQVRMFSSMADLSGVDLLFQSEVSDQLIVHLDKKHIEKILYNLISNAFRYTAEGGTIQVKLREANDVAIINVRDTGKGIAKKDIAHVFDRFYQSPLNEYRSKEGFGIGLAVVKELVLLHGGAITVSSEVGVGTNFEVRLPFNLHMETTKGNSDQEPGQLKTLPVKKAASAMLSTADGHRPTVLVVDDHEEIRTYIASLIAENFDTREASNGEEALKLLSKNHIDLIVTDLMMPWLDGYGFIERLQEDDQLNKIPVMVVSARTTEDDKHRVLDAGVNEFLSKPFDPQELQKRIHNLLRESKKRVNDWSKFTQDQQTQENLENNVVKKLNQIILKHIADQNLSTDLVANELSASRSKAVRLIKNLTGQTPLGYIKEIRMSYVDELIKAGKIRNATEAANAIAMKNVTYFNKQYKSHFGQLPEFKKE